MATRKNNSRPRAYRAPAEPSYGVSLGNILGIAAGIVGLCATALGVLWGYFSLQHDTADNKAAIIEMRLEFKQLADTMGKRFDGDELETRRIDKEGTDYGKNKVDTRMQEIAEVKASEQRLEARFTAFMETFQPKLNTMADHVEQMWGEYMSRRDNPPQHVDPRKITRNP